MSIILLLCLALATTASVSGFTGFKNFGVGEMKKKSTALNAGAMKPMFDGTMKAPGEHPAQFVLEHENGARAIIRTYGCNALSYINKDGVQVMGTRKDAVGDDSKPYAGGAPHCFPQFGPGDLPQHGFARGMKFIPEERAKKLSFDRMIFKLEPTEETKAIWDYKFEYRVDITLREDCLEWDVIVKNYDDKEFEYTHGLHTYFDVSSLSNVKIEGGFAGKQMLNRLTETTSEGPSDTLTIAEPIDSMWSDCTDPIKIIDSGKNTVTTITRKGYQDTCVWSPFGDEKMGWDNYICVEPICGKPQTAPIGQFKETSYYMKVQCDKM
jgi:glucose-6-phosphate 1-epimerase